MAQLSLQYRKWEGSQSTGKRCWKWMPSKLIEKIDVAEAIISSRVQAMDGTTHSGRTKGTRECHPRSCSFCDNWAWGTRDKQAPTQVALHFGAPWRTSKCLAMPS